MKTVHKYGFEILDDFEILMPTGARILHVDFQRGRPCIWHSLTRTPQTRFEVSPRGNGPPDLRQGLRVSARRNFHDGERRARLPPVLPLR